MTRRPAGLLVALLLALPLVVLAQGASESLEREARSAFKSGRFRDAALKFQDAAAASVEAPRRGRLELQSAWSHYNDKNPRASREALRRALEADREIEIVAEFFSPEFLRIVDEVKKSVTAVPRLTPADLAETKRTAAEKLADGRAAEVVYDLTSLPADQLDPEAWGLLARAYDATGRPDAAAQARRAAAGEPAPRVHPTPAPASPPSTPGKTGSLDDILAGGRAALARGDAFMAQSMANRGLEIDPLSSEAYRLLGDSYAARGEKTLAEANWKQSLRLNEQNEATLVSLGEFYVGEKSWSPALDFLKRATVLNPANGQRLLLLARGARGSGDLPTARLVYAAAAEALPSDVALLTEQAAVLSASQDLDGALVPLMKAAGLSPDNARVRANLAATLRAKGQAREAEREYREALRSDPHQVSALCGLGSLVLAEGRLKDAEELFAAAAAAEPRQVDAALGLARARRLAGNLAGAAQALDGVRDTEDASVLNEAGAIAYERRQFSEAQALFERAAAMDPSQPEAKANAEKARAAAGFLKAVGAKPPGA